MSISLTEYEKLKKERDELAKDLDNCKEHLRDIKGQVSSFHTRIAKSNLPKWLKYDVENIHDIAMSYYTGIPGASHGFRFAPNPPRYTDFSQIEKADGTADKVIREYEYKWINHGFDE